MELACWCRCRVPLQVLRLPLQGCLNGVCALDGVGLLVSLEGAAEKGCVNIFYYQGSMLA